MKYLCLVHLSKEEWNACADDVCFEAAKGLQMGGHPLAAEPLHPIETATTLRIRNGQLSMVDGPFAETKETPMPYVDGFVAAVPTENKENYIAHAATVAPLFKEFGAMRVVECWGDDVPDGTLTSFPMAVKKEEHEVVVFSWVMWPSREVRDEGWKQLMADPRMTSGATPPYDGKRLIYGGFQTVLEL